MSPGRRIVAAGILLVAAVPAAVLCCVGAGVEELRKCGEAVLCVLLLGRMPVVGRGLGER